MAISDVLVGRQTWSDYISTTEQVDGFSRALARQQTALTLSERDSRLALEAGLGALDASFRRGTTDLAVTIDLGLDRLADGIGKLNADFNIAMGEVIWSLQLQNSRLKSILETLQAPLDTSAKELRRRAETAYSNGWYHEALADLLESERHNYQDFAVHRSIGNIYLFHAFDLEKAVGYFRKAAKYARPVDSEQAAEAHYYAGIVLSLLNQLSDGSRELHAAVDLNAAFYDAHYMIASVSALQGHAVETSAALKAAILGDQRYFARAEHDDVFNGVRHQIQTLLDELLSDAHARAERALANAHKAFDSVTKGRHKSGYQDVLSAVGDLINQAENVLAAASYGDCLQVTKAMDALREVVTEIALLGPLYARFIQLHEESSEIEKQHQQVVRQYGSLSKERQIRQAGCLFALGMYVIPGIAAGWAVSRVDNSGLGAAMSLIWPLTLLVSFLILSLSKPGSGDYVVFSALQSGVFVGLLGCVIAWFVLRGWPRFSLEAAKKENAFKRDRIAKSEAELREARMGLDVTDGEIRGKRNSIARGLSAIKIPARI